MVFQIALKIYFLSIFNIGLIAAKTKIIPYQYHSKARIPDQSFATIRINAAVLSFTIDMSYHSIFFIFLLSHLKQHIWLTSLYALILEFI